MPDIPTEHAGVTMQAGVTLQDGETLQAGGVRAETAAALLTRLADTQRAARAPALVAGVVRDGRLVWAAGRGRTGIVGSDTADGRPDANTQSRIGSISKTFTAVLVARLRDEGRLAFTDPLESHVPGTPLGDRTIGDLLSHTAGLRAETSGPWWERTPGEAWDGFAPSLEPGAVIDRVSHRHHYSNLGFGLLGEVVARVRGRSWYAALRDEVLEPLGLRRTTYRPEVPHTRGLAVHPWADVVLPEPEEDAGAMAPAGQLWSTIDDLGGWAAFLGGDTGGVLDPDTLAELRTPQVVETGADWSSAYGFGWQVLRAGGRTVVGHGGSMPGFLAGLYVDVEARVGAVLMANSTAGVPVQGLGLDLIGEVATREPVLPPEWAPDPGQGTETLAIVGPWYWGPSGFALRALPGGWLDLVPLGGRGRASRFRPTGRDEWIGLDGYYRNETLRVVRGPDGSVSHLDLATFVFTRQPYDPEAPVPGGVDQGGWRGFSA